MSEGDHESNGKVRLDPGALEDLARETASKQAADERWIQRVDDGVLELREGRTEWQRDMKATLAKVANQVQVLTVTRIVWPAAAVLGCWFLGGVVGVLVWLISGHKL